MRFIIQFWLLWLSPPKLYGGGGGNKLVNIKNPLERKLAKISEEKWNLYKSKYIPLENEWINQTKNMDAPILHQKAIGMTSSGIKANGGDNVSLQGKSMVGGRSGVNDYIDQASRISQSGTQASIGVTDNYLTGIQNNIAVGQGKSTQALNGIGTLANQYGDANNNRAVNSFYAQQARNGVYGALAGGALAAVDNKLSK